MSKKKMIIIGGSAIALIAVVVALILIFAGKSSDRVITILKMEGAATVSREGSQDVAASEGMTLKSGDTIRVNANSKVVILMDDDKYNYVEENTILNVIAEGDTRDSKTIINLERGAVTCHIDGKLGNGDSYEVYAPNAMMVVRGTTFRVEACNASQLAGRDLNSGMPANMKSNYDSGKLSSGFTRITVLEGLVATTLMNVDGTTGKTLMLTEGKETWIGSNPAENFFVAEETNIYSGSLPQQTIQSLLDITENNTVLCISKGELNNLLGSAQGQQTYTARFYTDNGFFGMQEVEAGSIVKEPTLMPSQTGYWNFDFTKSIYNDVEIYWVEE